MKVAIFYFTLALLANVPLYFVWEKSYHDGIIGRAALLLISFSAWAVVLDIVIGDDGTKYQPPRLGLAMLIGFTVYLIWHLWRFRRRVGKRESGCPADCPQDRRQIPDRRFLIDNQ